MNVRKINIHQVARKGISVIDAMVAVSILAVAALGTSQYRYYSTLDAKKADLQLSASRLALLFCEYWHGLDGDPNLAIDDTANQPQNYFSELTGIAIFDQTFQPAGFTAVETYSVPMNSTAYTATYYVTLSYQDPPATDADYGLRYLNVLVIWNQKGDPISDFTNWDTNGHIKSFALTTFVDISG